MDYKKYLTANNIIAVALILIGVIWLVCSIMRNIKIDNIPKWPKVEATVINSTIDSWWHGHNLGTRSITSATDSTIRYYPCMLYKYTVNNIQHQSEKVYFGGLETYNAHDINVLMGLYQPGSTIEVYVNPENSKESYVYNGTKSCRGVILSLIILAVGIYLVYKENFKMRSKGTETTEGAPVARSPEVERAPVARSPVFNSLPEVEIGERGGDSLYHYRQKFNFW